MFTSITYGRLTEEETHKQIVYNISEIKRKGLDYEIAVGTDSQSYKKSTIVTSIMLRTISKGAIFFRTKQKVTRFSTLQQKIIDEVDLAIQVAEPLRKYLRDTGFPAEEVYEKLLVDVDVGYDGKTSDLIPMATGWVKGTGFKVRIKPDSVAASRISDKYSKRGSDLPPKPHCKETKSFSTA